MHRTEPLISPEELQCLLGAAPTSSNASPSSVWNKLPNGHFGALLWLVKGIFLYAVLMNAEAASVMASSRYLWMRGTLELLCLSAFWLACLQPRARSMACASVLVASTTLLMDAMTWVASTA